MRVIDELVEDDLLYLWDSQYIAFRVPAQKTAYAIASNYKQVFVHPLLSTGMFIGSSSNVA